MRTVLTAAAAVVAGGCGLGMHGGEWGDEDLMEAMDAMLVESARHREEVLASASVEEVGPRIDEHVRRMDLLHAEMDSMMAGCGMDHAGGAHHEAMPMMERMNAELHDYRDGHAAHTDVGACLAAVTDQARREETATEAMRAMHGRERCDRGHMHEP